jgi:MraZ protein
VDTEYTIFRGTFPCTVDQKRRLTVPARLAKALTPRAKRTFVAVRGLEGCLSLYPLDYWSDLERGLQYAEFTDKPTRLAMRQLLAFAEDLVLDNQNRLTLSQGHLDFARIKRDAYLVGITNHLELWEPGRLDESISSPGLPSYEEAFARLGPVMSKKALDLGARSERDASQEGSE